MPQDVAQPPATAQPRWELQVLRQSTDRAWPACFLLPREKQGESEGPGEAKLHARKGRILGIMAEG